jgi:hypothetical protein
MRLRRRSGEAEVAEIDHQLDIDPDDDDDYTF